jgi:ribosomal protein S18 acetylase RimI-like enzyme
LIIRSYRPRDAAAVHEICLATGDAGEPAERILHDPHLMAYVFSDPYLLLQPELAFVAEVDGIVLGYVVAALETPEFFARWQFEWSPRFVVSHPGSRTVNPCDADNQLCAFLHHPRLMMPPDIDSYPSHLHINLLAGARRLGAGRRLLDAVFAALADAGSRGVQLGVQENNTGAQEFYRDAGMRLLTSDARNGVRFGRPLGR